MLHYMWNSFKSTWWTNNCLKKIKSQSAFNYIDISCNYITALNYFIEAGKYHIQSSILIDIGLGILWEGSRCQLLKCVGKCLNCQMIGHHWLNCTAWWVDFDICRVNLTWLTNGNPSKYIPLHTRTSTNVRCAYSCLGNWSVNDVITVVTRTSWLSKPMV